MHVPTHTHVRVHVCVCTCMHTSHSLASAPPSSQVEVDVYFCEESGVCHMQEAVLSVPLQASETAQRVVTVTYDLQSTKI